MKKAEEDSSSSAGSEDVIVTSTSEEFSKSTESEVQLENFESLIKLCGDGGRWQLKVFLLTSFCGFLTAIHNLVYAFIGAAPDHWCELPQIANFTTDELKNLTIPIGKNDEYEKCSKYEWIYSNTSSPPISVFRNVTESCGKSIDFDSTTFDTTIVTDFNLVCGDAPWASLVQAAYMFGILVGSPIFGAISDRLGRKRSIWIASIIFIIAGPLVAIAPNFPLLMFARFILGASSPGIYGTSFVLIVETVGVEWRGIAGTLFCLPFALGYMVLPGVAYFFRQWRHLQLVLSIPSLLQILVCLICPESPRWLLRKGKVEEAEKVLREAARGNGIKNLPSDFSERVARAAGIEKEVIEPVTSYLEEIKGILYGYAQLFRTPKLRMRTLVIYISWMSCSLVYYGVALNSPNLSADRYLYTFISGVLEIPSYLMIPPLIKHIGRRFVFSGLLLICGVSLLVSLLFAQGSALIISLALFGKLLIGSAYALVYLYASEVMPTLLRTYGVGTASMVGRIGSTSAPFIVDLMGRDNKTYPTLVFGIVSLCAGLLTLLLPETRNKRLPETVQDIENEPDNRKKSKYKDNDDDGAF